MSKCEFLRVNAFLDTALDARAVKSALDLGLVDLLLGPAPASPSHLSGALGISPAGLRLLLDMLEVNGVVARTGDLVELTAEFREALRFRDLLGARIEFADRVWPDIHSLFTTLLTDLPQFMARSRTFDLFRYDRCFDITAENLAAALAWTKITTCLTKYEAGSALDAIGLDSVGRLIDLGGNTGEFALQACRRNPKLEATVVDLPVICELGRRHLAEVAAADEAIRIAFFPADMRSAPLPSPGDLVSFKSVLHDWPDGDAVHLLERAHTLVRPGGDLLIFERAPLDFRGRRISYAMAPALAFLHFLRPADLYLEKLGELGFEAIEYRRIELDMGFHLVTARRPG